MNYVRTLTAEEEATLQKKAARDNTKISAMLDVKIAQYIEDAARDNGADDAAQVAAALAQDPSKIDAVKAALGL